MFSFFERLVDPFPAEDRGRPPGRLLPFIIFYSRRTLPFLAAIALLTAVLSGIEIWLIAFLGDLVDWLGRSNPATFLQDHGWALVGMGVVLALYPLVTYVQALVQFQSLYANYPMLVRWRAHRAMLAQSLTFFQDEFAGRVSQKVMQTALAVRDAVSRVVEIGVSVVVFFVGTVWLMTSLELWFAVPLAVWLAAYVALMRYYLPRLGAVGETQANTRAEMTGRVVDSYTNIQTIKLFAHTERERDYARSAMTGFLDTAYAQGRLFTNLGFVLNLINSALIAVVAGISIWAWQRGAVTVGAITVTVGLVTRLRTMSHWIFWEVAGLFESIGTVADGMGMLTKPVSIVDRPDAKPLAVPNGEIVFDRARFHYGRASKVIEDFSLKVAPGEKIGLVGRSGAGKSTLVNLLLRFYDLEGGHIRIDGQDIASVAQESLRGQIGMVTQDTSLLHRSVRDNIAYGRPDATDAEIIAAAKLAHADEFIQNLVDPKGRTAYDAHVGERGVKLSGGQRQRVAIARIFLKNAPILVLDEATSALDSEVEAAIQETLYGLMAGKTVIAIAHRLSTIAAMDRLVVLDKGRVVEVGRHDELLRQKGLYAQLWSRQSGGFLVPEAVGEAAE